MDIQADPSFRSPNDPARRANGSAGAGISVSLKVNGTPHALTLDPRTTILDLVREHLELTGTKRCASSPELEQDRKRTASAPDTY